MAQSEVAEESVNEVESPAEEQSDLERLATLIDAEDGDVPEEEKAKENSDEEEKQEEAEDAVDEGSIQIDPEAEVFDVVVKTVGGSDEQRKVSLNELTRGYMRTEDYHRKTTELAEARKTLDSVISEKVEPMRQAYLQNLNFLHQAFARMVLPELQGVDKEKLAADNPSEFVKLTAKSERVQSMLQQIQAQQQQEIENARQEQIRKSVAALKDPVNGIPNWSDELYQSLMVEGTNYGFSPEEVAAVTDHRMMRVLHDAAQYRKLQATKAQTMKKIAIAPKVIKPGVQQESSKDAKVKQLKTRLAKSGSVRDAADLLMELER